MFKYFKTILCMVGVLFTGVVFADISSVAFVHSTILDVKGIDLSIGAGIDTSAPNSVRYLMRAIDAANAVNGTVTNYATSASAVSNVTTSARVIADVTELIVEPAGFRFALTGVAAKGKASFSMSAAGTFTVNWGDGSATETIVRTDTTGTTYSHTYTNAGDYVVSLDGLATSYSASENVPAVSFTANQGTMTAISGDLGKIFPILNASASGAPRFYQSFRNCSKLTSLPGDLFAGLSGTPSTYMFNQTFSGCSGLKFLPGGLFAGVLSPPASYMFNMTFYNCTGIKSIPADLFAGVSGAPATSVFARTFHNCTELTEIPAGLFSGISGPPAQGMFHGTFFDCSGLTGAIPPGLFGKISGAPATLMFSSTFSGCSRLTGEIPTGLFAGISGPVVNYMFNYTFQNCSGLTGKIPAGLFGKLSGAPTLQMFDSTFQNCSGLTGVSDGIWDLSGLTNASASYMFRQTFYGCTNITSATPSIAAGSSVKLWSKFSAYAGENAFGAEAGTPKWSDYASIPTGWK